MPNMVEAMKATKCFSKIIQKIREIKHRGHDKLSSKDHIHRSRKDQEIVGTRDMDSHAERKDREKKTIERNEIMKIAGKMS
ncbi:hypothetical protein L6164_018117 [Bauhinia variegata]|uniref:Uncharacterized protein n=1 Tax=Bauhinia variegata TaxID=167791 RepID=A0ACB9NDL9_BAUVA|nr:hypothetical protein L6164_018117 [Bauhinia variegata]